MDALIAYIQVSYLQVLGYSLVRTPFLFEGHCYGCRNNGSLDVKHPNDIDAYAGGHLDGYLPFGYDESSSDDDV